MQKALPHDHPVVSRMHLLSTRGSQFDGLTNDDDTGAPSRSLRIKGASWVGNALVEKEDQIDSASLPLSV